MTKTELASCVFLIVDDDEFSRAIITDALNHLGCQQIYQADNGASAQRLAQAHQPDFILLDIYMPDTQGWDLIQPLRQACPRAVVLMVTGSSEPDDFRTSLGSSVDGYCIKPVSSTVLLRALTNARLRRAG